MKLIDSKVEILPQSAGLEGIYRQIELAGRTCYKSEDKITADSAKEFVQRMINNGHTAMLEHGTVYMCVPVEDWERDAHEWEQMFPEGMPWVSKDCDGRFYLITTNFRHIIEGEIGIETMLKYLCQPVNGHEKRVSVRFTCDRGVSHELVRHRVFSFAQESTRYCNYSKDKFGNELTFIIPSWMNLNEGEYSFDTNNGSKCIVGDGYYYDMCDGIAEEPAFLYSLLASEGNYFRMLDFGWKPQQARQVLPNALKTEVVMTGFLSDWEHFFELRCAPNAHPDMKKLADELHEKFIESKLL